MKTSVVVGLLASLAACAPQGDVRGPAPGWVNSTDSGKLGIVALPPVGGGLQLPAELVATAARIRTAALADHGAYDKLAVLTDQIGHRLSGSPELDRAIAWAVQALKADGHDVHTEAVMVPHWVRGAEHGELLTPTRRPLAVLGLGGTVSTPKGGITARVVVVHDWKELEAKQAAVAGAIVLFDVAMPKWTEAHGSGYGDIVGVRVGSASAAAKLGAVGVLMRSVTAHSLHTLHTGAMHYDDGVARIPAAAITVEDAGYIDRQIARGVEVTVHLELASQALPDAPSANVVAELRGRELPDQIVLIGGHIDSWDVGQGAHDDGAGCVIMMQALATLRHLGLTPRRTIRVVLFTNEENGTRGAKAYAAAHAAEIANHVTVIESDIGGFAPRGFDLQLGKDTPAARKTLITDRLTRIAALLQPIGSARIVEGHAGTDVEPLVDGGAIGLGLDVDNRTYFDIHHSEADTLDKVDADQLAANVATVAVMAYVLAELPTSIAAP